ncbi:MAG TPA: hypothetical protein VLI90_15410 [Tepidisphaeraceae bacterium]|nr:hypothetical protein [Tepidisphaeraceae bacterium]
MDFLKTVGGKIAGGLVALAVIAAAISWWQTDPATRHAIVSAAGRLTGWSLSVLALPWLCFWIVGWVARMDSNFAGAALVFILTALEAVALAWLFGWSIHGATGWIFYIAAVLVAAVYNLFTCDWIAEQIE